MKKLLQLSTILVMALALFSPNLVNANTFDTGGTIAKQAACQTQYHGTQLDFNVVFCGDDLDVSAQTTSGAVTAASNQKAQTNCSATMANVAKTELLVTTSLLASASSVNSNAQLPDAPNLQIAAIVPNWLDYTVTASASANLNYLASANGYNNAAAKASICEQNFGVFMGNAANEQVVSVGSINFDRLKYLLASVDFTQNAAIANHQSTYGDMGITKNWSAEEYATVQALKTIHNASSITQDGGWNYQAESATASLASITVNSEVSISPTAFIATNNWTVDVARDNNDTFTNISEHGAGSAC